MSWREQRRSGSTSGAVSVVGSARRSGQSLQDGVAVLGITAARSSVVNSLASRRRRSIGPATAGSDVEVAPLLHQRDLLGDL